MKPWYRSKTIWTQILVAVMAALVELAPSLRELFPTHLGGWIVVALTVFNIGLRVVTNQPIGRPDR